MNIPLQKELLMSLPDLERDVELDCSRLADIALNNIPAEERPFWLSMGVNVGHA